MFARTSLLVASLSLLAITADGAEAWMTALARQVDDTRVGMTFEEVKQRIPQSPFARRVYLKNSLEIVEWIYPTGDRRWSTLVFERGKLASRRDRTAPTYPREVYKPSPEDTKTREKLRTVTIGADVARLDALGLVPRATISSADWRTMMATPEMRNLLAGAETVGRALGTTESVAGALAQLDPTSFDELRSFELSGESVSITIKDGKLTEIIVSANPDPQWALRQLAMALSKRKPTSADFEKIKPGMSLVEVTMTLGIPSSEEKRTTATGSETTLRYRLSRRQSYEILVRDEVVITITSRSNY